MRKAFILLCIFMAGATGCSPRALPSSATRSPEALTTAVESSWVETTLASMSLKQKIGQLFIIGLNEKVPNTEVCGLIQQFMPAGLIYQPGNVYNPVQVRHLSKGLQDCARQAGMKPLFISLDHEGEYVNYFNQGVITFPAELAQGAAGDPLLAYQAALGSGQELAYSGINMVLGPDADVLLNADNVVISQRTFGGDPSRVSQFVEQAVKGYQQAGVIPVLKHFPGHGGVSSDSHEMLPVDNVDLAGLKSSYLPPFQRGLEAGAPAVMLAHIAFPNVDGSNAPASLSSGMVKILRESLGFQGVIMTDSLNMKGVTGENLSMEEAALHAVEAGTDLLLISTPGSAQPAYDRLLAAAQSGELSMDRIDASLRRILSLKAARRLASFPLPIPPDPNWQTNTRVAEEIGKRAVALLQNGDNLVPISPSLRRILILGPKEEWDFYTKLETALKAQGHTLESFYYPIPWSGSAQDQAELESMTSKAADFDLILIFTWQAHLNKIQFGETFQPELVEKLSGAGRPVIIVALKSPTDILSLPAVPAYIATFGTTAGQLQSVQDILTGAAKSLGQNPLPGLIK